MVANLCAGGRPKLYRNSSGARLAHPDLPVWQCITCKTSFLYRRVTDLRVCQCAHSARHHDVKSAFHWQNPGGGHRWNFLVICGWRWTVRPWNKFLLSFLYGEGFLVVAPQQSCKVDSEVWELWLNQCLHRLLRHWQDSNDMNAILTKLIMVMTRIDKIPYRQVSRKTGVET